jgi:hypothetical protein
VRLDGKSPFLQLVQDLPLARRLEHALDDFDVEDEEPEPPPAGDLRVQLSEAPCRGVARVGEGGFAVAFPLGVEPGERAPREVDLAPDFHQGRVAPALEHQRQVGNGLEVLGDHLAHQAVAPGAAGHEAALLVGQADRGPVDLDLGGIAAVPGLRVEAGVPVLPRGELLGGERVGQREHRSAVGVLDQRGGRLGADALGRAVGSPEPGVGVFQGLQLAQQAIVFRVGDFGRVEDVVGVVRAVERGAEGGGALGGSHESRVVSREPGLEPGRNQRVVTR